MDDRLKQLLHDLGDAINESISGSETVSARIQRIRDEGYDLYVVLDATIGLDRNGDTPPLRATVKTTGPDGKTSGQFRINVNDLAMLRSLGIDPTRKVRTLKRIEAHHDPAE